MLRESGGRRGPRRPRRERDRDRDRPRDPAEAKERIDRDFAREIEMRIAYFLQSPEEELELEAMNSYRRRMVHNIASRYHLRSESRGEDRDRYVCLVKTPETTATADPAAEPAAGAEGEETGEEASEAPREVRAPRPVRLWDYGSQTFPVNPGPQGIHMALKADGSIEMLRNEDRSHVVSDRLVTTHEFRVRNGKILIPGDPGY
jgi:R3H domain